MAPSLSPNDNTHVGLALMPILCSIDTHFTSLRAPSEPSSFTKNFGTMKHEFLVVKTDFEPGKIPLTSESRFDEEAEGLEVIDEIPEFEVKTTGMLTVKLDPGKYQLLCNIAGHYAQGMYADLVVVAQP